jgi:hypothetical protein
MTYGVRRAGDAGTVVGTGYDDSESLLGATGYRVFTIDGREVGVLEVDRHPQGAHFQVRQKIGLLRSRRIPLPAGEVRVVNSDDEMVVLHIGSQAFDRLAHGHVGGASAFEPSIDDEQPPDGASRNLEAGPSEAMEDRAPNRSSPAAGETPAGKADQWVAADPEAVRSQYLLFIGTAAGYVLLEHDAKPGPVGTIVDVPDFAEGPFIVTKLAASPLPRDERRCAYLQQVR